MSDPSMGESSEDLAKAPSSPAREGLNHNLYSDFFVRSFKQVRGLPLFFYGIVWELHIVLEGCRCDCQQAGAIMRQAAQEASDASAVAQSGYGQYVGGRADGYGNDAPEEELGESGAKGTV